MCYIEKNTGKYKKEGLTMINFLNLEYFLAASEELNFTRAAKRLLQ